VSIETAKSKRRCYRDGSHSILRGDRCLVIAEGTFQGSKNYCAICAVEILAAAERKHSSLEKEIVGQYECDNRARQQGRASEAE
jgi:hypothetical protein